MIRWAYISCLMVLFLACMTAPAFTQPSGPKKCKSGYELKKVTKKVVYYKWVTSKKGKKIKKRLVKQVTRKQCVRKKAEAKEPENQTPAPEPQKPPEHSPQPQQPSTPIDDPDIPDRVSLMSVLARDPDARVSPRWSLTASRQSVPSGTITIDFVNYGGDPHNLLLRSSTGSPILVSDAIAGDMGEGPGLKQSSIRVPAGQYVLYCAISNHEQLGMRADLLVTD